MDIQYATEDALKRNLVLIPARGIQQLDIKVGFYFFISPPRLSHGCDVTTSQYSKAGGRLHLIS